MKRYKLYTEDKNLDTLTALFKSNFESFSFFKQTGVWKGQSEPSVVFEVIVASDPIVSQRLQAITDSIKSFNKQETILITIEDLEVELV